MRDHFQFQQNTEWGSIKLGCGYIRVAINVVDSTSPIQSIEHIGIFGNMWEFYVIAKDANGIVYLFDSEGDSEIDYFSADNDTLLKGILSTPVFEAAKEIFYSSAKDHAGIISSGSPSNSPTLFDVSLLLEKKGVKGLLNDEESDEIRLQKHGSILAGFIPALRGTVPSTEHNATTTSVSAYADSPPTDSAFLAPSTTFTSASAPAPAPVPAPVTSPITEENYDGLIGLAALSPNY